MARSRRRRRGSIALVTALTITAAACGAQHGDETVAARAPTRPTATTTATPLTSIQLEAGLLTAADLPQGFDVETRGDPPGGLAAHLTALDPACQPALDELAPDGGDMDMPTAAVSYERGQVARVSHQLSQSADAVERFRNARRILQDACGGVVAFRMDGGSGHYLLRPGPRIGDETIYLRSHLQTRISGVLATIDGFVVFVRLGDIVSTVSGHTYRVPALGLAAQRPPQFAEAVAVARRATRRLRRAIG